MDRNERIERLDGRKGSRSWWVSEVVGVRTTAEKDSTKQTALDTCQILSACSHIHVITEIHSNSLSW
jgi:hypothetical protein